MNASRRGRHPLGLVIGLVVVGCLGSSCGTKLETFNVPAFSHQTTWKSTGASNDFIACPVAQFFFLPFFPFVNVTCADGLDVSLGPLDTKGGGAFDLSVTDTQIAVGFDRQWDPGTEPCPCWSWTSRVYRGEAQFGLSNLPGKHSPLKTIVSATLVFTLEEFLVVDGSAVSNEVTDILGGIYVRTPPSPDIAGATGIAPNPGFAAGTEAFLVPFPNLADIGEAFPTSGLRIRQSNRTISVDISNQVRAWISGKEPNLGLVFVGRDEALPEKANSARVVKIDKIHLEILANPFQ